MGLRRSRSPIAIAIAAVVAVAIGNPARADEAGVPGTGPAVADPEARRLAAQGLAHFEAGRYDDAIRDLDASYRITPAPGLLYNLAQAQRLKGDCAAALDLYRRFLREQPTGTIRQRSEARIAEMERCVTDARPADPAPATEAITAAAPSLVPPPVAPAPATAPPTGKIDLSKPAPAPLAARAEFPWRRRLAIGFGGAAVALAGGSVYFARRADQASDDVSGLYDRGVAWGPYAMSREQDGQRAATWSLALGVSAAISAALAAWMYVRR